MSRDPPSASLIGEHFFSSLYTFNLLFLASLSLEAFSTIDQFDFSLLLELRSSKHHKRHKKTNAQT